MRKLLLQNIKNLLHVNANNTDQNLSRNMDGWPPIVHYNFIWEAYINCSNDICAIATCPFNELQKLYGVKQHQKYTAITQNCICIRKVVSVVVICL